MGRGQAAKLTVTIEVHRGEAPGATVRVPTYLGVPIHLTSWASWMALPRQVPSPNDNRDRVLFGMMQESATAGSETGEPAACPRILL